MNLLVVTVDSLRFDHVSLTNPKIRTPEFDRIAQARLDFIPTCFSVSSATRPVHTSLFSGLYPFEHGIESQRDGTIRSGTPRLLRLMEQANYATGAFSEAPEIFAGLDLGVPIQRLEGTAHRGHDQLRNWLSGHHGQACCLFAHYWSAHAPYGAADGKAMGETAELLRRGDLETVQQRYRAAVIELFEHKLAPLLRRLDPFEWALVILGDHGESWTPEELYHGQTLRNSVLHVPLFVHLPRVNVLTPPPQIVSVADLFPTLANLFELPAEYRGFAHSLSTPGSRNHYGLAELKPLDPRDSDDEVGQRVNANWSPAVGRKWALFDERQKFTFDEGSATGELEETFSETTLIDQAASDRFLEAYERMRTTSEYAHRPLESSVPGSSALIDDRLRALGYLP